MAPILRPPPGPVATADFSAPEPVTHAVEVRRLAKRDGDFDAVRGVTFDVDEGETFGFLGPNGAGNSTTQNAG